jgi:hypothetical protein
MTLPPKKKHGYKYYRDCQHCGNQFGTNRDWQKFCTTKRPLCKDEYWKIKRRVRSLLEKEIEILKKEIEKLKNQNGSP